MASHRRPKQPSRARISVLTAAAATAVAISAQAGAANAAPKPNKDQVKAKVDKLYEEAEAATESYDGAKEKLKHLREQATQLQDQVARQQAAVSKLEAGLGSLAAAQYRSGGIDPTVQLMLSSDPDDFLAKAASTDQVSNQQADALRLLQEQQRRLDQQKAEAAATLAELDRTTAALRANKAEMQSRLHQAQSLLNSLTAQERAALEAADARASRGSDRVDLSSLPPASGAAGVAVQAALSRRGDPYVSGAEGPSSFDCSGLTQWAYAQAGVSLPRIASAQGGVGVRVPSLAQAQPGDLIIYYGGAHVGMYIGNGMVVHAPKPGRVVEVVSASSMPIYTIRRIV
ncbi:C40 family peptidase [Peterkaempfera griseoplana]|uniref:C40 family peptidase n=1 Tax=Peterkaempfera griseoplana TaxID=66896 RepID=UPI0006E139A8|nr:C40 family peptidase [Peterkaempfera griseoplana]